MHLNYGDVAIIKEGTRFTSGSVPSLIHDGSAGITHALHNQSIFNLLNGRNIEADDVLELEKANSNSKTESNAGKSKTKSEKLQ